MAHRRAPLGPPIEGIAGVRRDVAEANRVSLRGFVFHAENRELILPRARESVRRFAEQLFAREQLHGAVEVRIVRFRIARVHRHCQRRNGPRSVQRNQQRLRIVIPQIGVIRLPQNELHSRGSPGNSHPLGLLNDVERAGEQNESGDRRRIRQRDRYRRGKRGTAVIEGGKRRNQRNRIERVLPNKRGKWGNGRNGGRADRGAGGRAEEDGGVNGESDELE